MNYYCKKKGERERSLNVIVTHFAVYVLQMEIISRLRVNAAAVDDERCMSVAHLRVAIV